MSFVFKDDFVFPCCCFFPTLKQFQASLAEHFAAEVHIVLPRFKLVIMHLRQLLVNDGKVRAEQSDTQGKDGETLGTGHMDLAYVLHTSGTTGHPKTVRVPHKCIVPNIVHLR